MKKQTLTFLFFFSCTCFLSMVAELNAAACPTNKSYALLYYDHQLLNQYVAAGTYSQASGLSGAVGLEISPAGVFNAGNNKLNRTIDLVITTADCDCLSETAQSIVTVSITGTCSNGVLHMQINEVYPDSSAPVTCEGDDSCGSWIQQFPGSTNDFTMVIDYIDGATIVQPYSCPDGCLGSYSWRLQFTEEPPPEDDIQAVPLAPLLHLLLRQANQ